MSLRLSSINSCTCDQCAHASLIWFYIAGKTPGALSLVRPGIFLTNLTARSRPITSRTTRSDAYFGQAVPLIPVQSVMAAAQMTAHECLPVRMLKLLAVIIRVQEQPLPQPSISIHYAVCAANQLIQVSGEVTKASESKRSQRVQGSDRGEGGRLCGSHDI